MHRVTRELRKKLYESYEADPSMDFTRISGILLARQATNLAHQQISSESYFYSHLLAGLMAWGPRLKNDDPAERYIA